MHSQITRIRNKDGSETLKRRNDGLTLAYSAPNLTTMLTGVTDPLFVLKRIDNNGTTEGSTYPFKYVARDQTEFTTANFDTVWNLLLSNPDRPFPRKCIIPKELEDEYDFQIVIGMLKGQKFWVLGDTYTFIIKGAETDGQYAVFEISSPPGSGPPLHTHTKESESFYVIVGEFSFQYGDDKTVAKPGAFLHQKKGIPHTFKNIGNNTGRLLFTIIPAGFENFFAEVGILVEDEATFSPPSMDIIDITKIVTIAQEKYGLKF